MASQSRTGTQVEAIQVRMTYFEGLREIGHEGVGKSSADSPTEFVTVQRRLDHPNYAAGTVSLPDASAALAQTDRYLRNAHLLSVPNWPELPTTRRGQVSSGVLRWSDWGDDEFRLIAIEMRSPLTILIKVGKGLLVDGIGVGLVMLAERICTFGPRVSRRRKQDLLMATIYDSARREIQEGRADGLALELLRSQSRLGLPAPSPDKIDFLDDFSDESELEPVRIPDRTDTRRPGDL